MEDRRRLTAISNSYYNIGLEKAHQRNLSGAIVCLNKALQFNNPPNSPTPARHV